MDKENQVDTNLGLKSLLLSFVKIFEADVVILYKFIQKEELEATELLSLLLNSPILENGEDFYNNTIKNDFIKYKGGLKGLIEAFRDGRLPEEDKAEEDKINGVFKDLKNNIRVLRFSAHAEKNPEKTRWNFDFNKRPPKYLVFSDVVLKKPKGYIKHEGITALFCRASKEKTDLMNQLKSYKKMKESPSITAKGKTKIISKQETKEGNVKSLFLERRDLRGYPSHSKIHADPNVYDNFSSHHAAWMILNDPNDNGGKPIGCLRFEFYDQNSIGEIIENAKQKLNYFAIEPVNKIIVTDILNVLEKNKEYSYAQIYKCLEPILDHIKDIGNQKRRNLANCSDIQLKHANKDGDKNCSTKKKNERIEKESKIENDINKQALEEAQELHDIHYQIEHLLYVLKRNTYFGEDIIKRVKFFIKVLLKKLSLPGDIFTDVWDRLKRHEDLMLYQLDKYRDHLMHQFHTFLCGYIIIHRLGLGFFQNLINNNYSRFISKEYKEKNKKKEKLVFFTQLDVLRIWTLASLFHDCGYAFEKLSEGLETFSKRVSGLKLKSMFFWDDFLFKNKIVPKIFQSLSSYYTILKNDVEKECKLKSCHSKLTESYIFRVLTQKALNDNDHGVLSSIILMQHYYKHKEGFSRVPRIVHIINIACLAIALHNKSVFKEIKNKDNTGICLSLNPIIFLLVYCDTATEWGRIKIRDKNDTDYSEIYDEENNKFVTPSLDKISIDKDEVDESCLKTSILLDYPASESGIYLDPESIDSYLSSVITSFVSPKDKGFEIKYEIRGSEKDRLSKRFTNCAYCDNLKQTIYRPSH